MSANDTPRELPELTEETIARHAHISNAEILRDIDDTEREIAEVERLAPLLGPAHVERHFAVNAERRSFIAKLRALLAARGYR